MFIEANIIKEHAISLVCVHGGILEAYSFTEYILMSIEQQICLFGMKDKLMDKYGFYCSVLDYLEAMIKMN